jgi:hypothetical protein
MSKTKIAEYKWRCENLFLRINNDYSKEIPGVGDDTLRTTAYIETPSLAPSFDRPPDPPYPGNKPYKGFYFVLLGTGGDGDPLNLVTGMRWKGSGGVYPWGAIPGFFTGFEFDPWINGYGYKVYTLRIKYVNELGTEITDYKGTFWDSISEPFPVQALQWRPTTPPSPDPPREPPDPPGPGSGQPRLIVEKETETGITSTTLEDPFTQTVNKAWFQCDDCDNHCVLLVRQKTDKFQQGICICKDKEEDLEEMKARIKAELLQELPPIVQTRIKAQDLPGLKTEVSQDLDQKIATAKSEIKSELEGDESFKAGLKDQIKSELLADSAFMQSLTEQVTQAIQEESFKTQYFEFLNGNKIAEIITASLSEESKLNALKTKLGITPTNDPNSPSDPNKLTANGYEWTIAKDTAGEVTSVSRTAQPNDNLSTLTNSGSAIVTALKAKFTGKNFSVTSSSQSAGTYTYSIDQY